MSARWSSKFNRLKAGPSNGKPPPALVSVLDPYFRWALATSWRGFAELARWNRVPEAPPQVQLMVDAEGRLNQLLAQARWRKAVHESYTTHIPGTRILAQHFTAQFTPAELDKLARDKTAPRWRLAMPLRDARSAAQASPKGYYGVDRDLAAMRADNVVADAIQNVPQPDTPARLDGAIAIIDFGCPFLNSRFATEDGTRVRALWDQGSKPDAPPRRPQDTVDPALGWPWHAPAQFKYGREMGPRTLDCIAHASHVQGGADESAVYRGIDHLIAYADPRRRTWMATHGGHVMDVAAGTVDPLTNDELGDPASSAPLVFVQLPSLTAADSAGGSLGAHVLDGVRYAMALVPAGRPLVVVVSYGNSAGPHDGSSPIELALAELLRSRGNNFAIVLAAGNARDDRGHARRTVRPDRSVMLRLLVADGDTTDTFVEIWYSKQGLRLQMRVRPPSSVWSDWVAPGDDEQLMRSTGTDNDVVAMIRHDSTVPNGTRALAMLALAPTAQPPGVDCALAEPGLWEIELRLHEDDLATAADAVLVDAWIERDDPVRGTAGGRTHFADQEDTDQRHTFSGIATGEHTIKACGFNRGSGRPTAYSSLPEAGQASALTVLVACEEDVLNPSIAAAATRSSDIYRMNGTSVSAPVLARRLYAVMCAGEVPRQGWADVLRDLGQDGVAVKPFRID